MHQLVSVRARALHLHGSVRELGAHDQAVVQVVSAAAPAIAGLQDLRGNRTARAQPQISGGARPSYGVADGRCRQGVDERGLSCSCFFFFFKKR